MNSRNLWYTNVAIITFVVIILYFNDTKSLYGNDEQSITKIIGSIEEYKGKSIQILEIKDIDNLRIVPFLSNNSPGRIEFRRNQDGNFKWSSIEVRENQAFSSFLVLELPGFMFVSNSESELTKMQVNINGVKLEQTFTPNKVNVSWLVFPETEDSEYTFRDYKYYDKDGNLINED